MSPRLIDTIANFLAEVIVRRPLVLIAALALSTLLAAVVLVKHTTFDSDILNLLPTGEPAVKGLRDYERGFAQSNELAFVLVWPEGSGSAEEREDFRDEFSARLLAQPWVLRVLSAQPLAGGGGGREIVLPLLLNLPSGDFQEALKKLDPLVMEERISRLAGDVAAGSPRAVFELENDPLGLGASALKPLWNSLKVNNAFDLTSPDGLLHIVPCITRQTDSSPEGCKALMRDVHQFVASLGAGESPRILVTGRAAYVDEISSSMERDIKLTSVVSLAAVVGLFWLGFRRLWPLVGIAVLLTISAVLAIACGGLVFGSLNVVAIGFCSILFGLGDDFSLLICQRYYHAAAMGLSRRDAVAQALKLAGPGILWVALTTAAGFLALCFAGSPGFRQLGALVAIGVLLATGIMLIMLPLFLHGKMPSTARDTAFLNYAQQCHSKPLPLLGMGVVLGLLGLVLCLSPWRPLQFDLTPASLEPTRTPAAQALALMMSRFPDTFEPVIAVIENPQPSNLAALDLAMEEATKAGLITSYSSPKPLVLSSQTLSANRKTLSTLDLAQTAMAFSAVLDQHGLAPAAFRETFSLFEALHEPSSAVLWDSFLPENSTWWFLIDRMVSSDGTMAAAQIQTRKNITWKERLLLGEKIASVSGASATGWSQTLASLVPWATGELVMFGGIVFGVIAGILVFVYRDWRAWALHLGAMVASIALAAALLKLLNIPINILNVLALPLVLGVGVDYGTHIILATREGDQASLAHVLKPVWISGLTTISGFGALVLAANPALSGLGAVCAVGVFSCLILAFLFVAPSACLIARLAPGKFRA